MDTAESSREMMIRWRLILGRGSEEALGCSLEGEMAERDAALEYLYRREYGAGRNVFSTGPGSLDDSALTVPEWINSVHRLFPKKTIERMEKDALEHYQLNELVTNAELLSRAKPSMTLLKAVLHTKHLMNREVLAMARALVRKVVEELMEKFVKEVRTSFAGAVLRHRRGALPQAANFDARTTIRRNLQHYDTESERLFIRKAWFFSRTRRHSDRWKIIILIDESGSMAGSVIHSAVTAAIFAGLPAIRTHLLLFDTNVVDLSGECADPVETIMKVQLGGGTDIGNALSYAESLVEHPRKTIVILITDFCEGGPLPRFVSLVAGMVESGVTMLGLAALDEECEPRYDKNVASMLVQRGMHVGAMTPGELAEWVAGKVR